MNIVLTPVSHFLIVPLLLCITLSTKIDCPVFLLVEILGRAKGTFFTLMYAFYSGALTMFFLTEDELPFTNSRDVLKLFPDWKLIFKDGYEQNFEFPAKRVRRINESDKLVSLSMG